MGKTMSIQLNKDKLNKINLNLGILHTRTVNRVEKIVQAPLNNKNISILRISKVIVFLMSLS